MIHIRQRNLVPLAFEKRKAENINLDTFVTDFRRKHPRFEPNSH